MAASSTEIPKPATVTEIRTARVQDREAQPPEPQCKALHSDPELTVASGCFADIRYFPPPDAPASSIRSARSTL
jgi:hypothetical protein